jgi:sulfofructosephosphate aldolase
MTTDGQLPPIEALARESGGYAMVALDQRESMRNMFVERGAEGSDAQLRDFKRVAANVLAPLASAVLMDRVFSPGSDLDLGDTPLILAVDDFEQPAGSPLLASRVDDVVTPELVESFGASALKQLVLWQEGADPEERLQIVSEFDKLCELAGRPGIIEGVVRSDCDWSASEHRDNAIVAAAAEFSRAKPGLYKAEVPAFGRADPDYLQRRCQDITDALEGQPWVVLSSGVDVADFPDAVRSACRGGARGFLAGRAIWADCIADSPDALQTRAVERLTRLVTIVDETVDGLR